jgi:RimJ/RimL family protein N-acetyltransferase
VTHISQNVFEQGIVAVRPMRRADVDAFAAWGIHTDPLFRHFNLPRLSKGVADQMWAFLAGAPEERRPFAGLLGDRVVASLIVRELDRAAGVGELGIILDPAWIGRGLGRRILAAFISVLAAEGFRRLQLEVAGYNERAIAAYRAAGFAVLDEYWADPEPGMDVGALLEGPAADAVSPNVRLDAHGRFQMRTVRMERQLDPQTKDDISP